MVSTFNRSAPNFEIGSTTVDIRQWIAAIEDFCLGLRMPHEVLIENVINKFKASERAKIRSKVQTCVTWAAFKTELLEMYSGSLQRFKLEQSLLGVTRNPEEKMALLLQGFF
jgi:hypothetical protein